MSLRTIESKARSFLPASIRNLFRAPYHHLLLRLAMARAMPKVPDIPNDILNDLIRGWYNSWALTDVSFLRMLLRAASQSKGPILECGSGLSTLILGMAAQKQNTKVFSLEHDAFWAERLKKILHASHLHSVEICLTPLKNYGEFDWYDLSQVPFPRTTRFFLAFCDGPPGNIRGGRYGLLPLMSKFLDPQCVILMDDGNRKDEKEIIRRWEVEFDLKAEVHTSKEGRVLVELKIDGERSAHK